MALGDGKESPFLHHVKYPIQVGKTEGAATGVLDGGSHMPWQVSSMDADMVVAVESSSRPIGQEVLGVGMAHLADPSLVREYTLPWKPHVLVGWSALLVQVAKGVPVLLIDGTRPYTGSLYGVGWGCGTWPHVCILRPPSLG